MRQPRVLKSLKTLYDELVAAQIQGLIRINSKNVNSHIRIEVIINFTVPFETRRELLKHKPARLHQVTATQAFHRQPH